LSRIVFEFAYFEITAGMVSIYALKTFIRREQFLISALIITLNLFCGIPGISFIREGNFAISTGWIFCRSCKCFTYPAGLPADLYLRKDICHHFGYHAHRVNNTNAPLLREMAFSAPAPFSIHYKWPTLPKMLLFDRRERAAGQGWGFIP